jgi:hypothetical protein
MAQINSNNTYAVTLKAGQPVIKIGDLYFPIGYAPNIDGMVLTVNGTAPDADGNVDVIVTASSIGALPAKGGTLTGVITVSGVSDFVRQSTNSSYVNICGGADWQHGAGMYLFGSEHPEKPGHVQFTAKNDKVSANFICTPDGKMTFAGRDASMGHPDYSVGAIAISDSSFTATMRGWLYIGAITGLYLNGTSISPTGTMLIPLQKGDTVSAASALNATFYPTRG